MEREGAQPDQNQESRKPQPQPKEQGRGERQPLPSVWDILEREVRLNAPDIKDRPRWLSKEYCREMDEVNRLQEELIEKGSTRDKLIRDLFYTMAKGPAPRSYPLGLTDPSLEQFQQFRARVEPMSDKKLGEELRQLQEKAARQLEEYHKRHRNDPRRMPRLTGH